MIPSKCHYRLRPISRTVCKGSCGKDVEGSGYGGKHYVTFKIRLKIPKTMVHYYVIMLEKTVPSAKV